MNISCPTRGLPSYRHPDKRPRETHALPYAPGGRTLHGIARVNIVETANRFARDLMIQEVGYRKLRERGTELIAADDSPSSFIHDGPTATPTTLRPSPKRFAKPSR
jgi:hypothetical protein